MWPSSRLADYLDQVEGRQGVWADEVLPRIKHAVVCALRCAQNEIKNRKASFELYGFDIMIDQVSVMMIRFYAFYAWWVCV